MHGKDRPKVGIGILIFNNNQILLGKRKSNHGISSWGLPGGHLEFRESLEDCAIREVFEETNIVIENPQFFAITNDIFEEENKHYISIYMKANLSNNQVALNMEPHKIADWQWFHLKKLPKNLFLPLDNLFSGFTYGQDPNEQHNQFFIELKSKYFLK